MADLISIIIPVYNSEKTLARCLRSVCSQTYSELEIILVDDGSTDNSLKICEDFATNDRRVQVISQKNCGPAAARNTGLKRMHGKYLAFVDADDDVSSVMYEKMLKSLINNKVDMVVCGTNCFDSIHNTTYELEMENKGLLKSSIVKQRITVHNYDCGGGFLWNRLINYDNLKKKNNGPLLFDESLEIFEDKCWIMDVLSLIANVFVMQERLYNYYVNGDSISHKKNLKKDMDYLRGWDKLVDALNRDALLTQEIESKYHQEYLNVLWNYRKEKDELVETRKEFYLNLKKKYPLNMKNIVKAIFLRFYL